MSARRSAASGALARREWPGARAAAREGSNERKRAPAGNISDGEHATRQQKGGVMVKRRQPNGAADPRPVALA